MSSTVALEQRSKDARILFRKEHGRICERTDRLIAFIMCLQWPAAIASAVWMSPSRMAGNEMAPHPHLLAAIYLGGLITLPPVALALLRPGMISTRHILAACQMLMSGLLIHISGGHLETHFHVFGSLAFLAFYLDWPVLVTATLVTLLNHGLMGYFMPISLFGTALDAAWRFAEHILWVIFCDVFLVTSCVRSIAGLKASATREADQEVLLQQAYHDALTGLGNRLCMQEVLTKLLSRSPMQSTSFTFLSIDLDGFREVNDSLGRQAGDAVLTEVATRLRGEIRTHDTLVRIGGDEFALVLPQCCEAADAESISARIVACLGQPIYYESHTIKIGASVGICLYPEAGTNIADLFHHADLALYKARESGRGGYHLFDRSMRDEVLLQMSLEHRLRTAVEDETLEVHYQPLVSTLGALLGFEALLRWNDAVHGFVSPATFIPLAEKTALIIPLGRWVLRQACLQAAQWHRSGNRLVKISVNVSAVQLADADFVTMVCATLRETDLPPELLDLELTESILIKDHQNTLLTLGLLRNLGVQLSIDDFGTGYSSLSYLRNLPVNRLKIDRCFVADIESSTDARVLIEGMIDMARSLHLRVVAEGVETAGQMAILADAGCDEIQGYYISKAIRPDAATRLVVNSQTLARGAAPSRNLAFLEPLAG